MKPQDPQSPNSNGSPFGTGGFSSSNMDIPPVPVDPNAPRPAAPVQPTTVTQVDQPTPMLPPVEPEVLATPSLVPPPVATVPPPPPPQSSGNIPGQSTIVTPKSGPKFPKKAIILILALLFFVLGAFVLIQVLLPRLSGGNSKSTITWWGLWEEPATVQPLIDEYQASHPGVVVKYERKSKEDYRERLTNAIASGQGPDIMTIHNTWVPMFRNSLSPLPASVFSPSEFQQTFYPVMTTDMTLGANLVGIPTGYDGLALYVNDEIFTTYGKTTPKTWNELRDTAIDLTIRDSKGVIKQAGVAMGSTKNVDHWQEILGLLMLRNGAKLEVPTGDLAEKALEYFTIFVTKDGVWNDTLPNSTTMFANGNLAMMIAPSWRIHEILEQKPALKFHIAPVPQLPKDSPDEVDMTYATYWVSAVSSKSTKQDQSWEFLKFMSTKESYQKLFDNATKLRKFGQPYPRVDMRDSLSNDPLVGGFVSLAGTAKSWYLVGRTFDGDTGINSRMNKYFEDAINAMTASSAGGDAKRALETVAQGVLQVLVDYGLAAAPPPVKK